MALSLYKLADDERLSGGRERPSDKFYGTSLNLMAHSIALEGDKFRFFVKLSLTKRLEKKGRENGNHCRLLYRKSHERDPP